MIALLLKFWYAPVIGVLFIAIGFQQFAIQRKDAALTHANDVMQISIERMKGAAATFKSEQEAKARAIESAQNQATQEAASDYSVKLRAALALAAQRVRNGQAIGGSASGASQVSGTSEPASTSTGNGGMPIVDENDLLICTTNTVKAQGWLAWWRKIQAIPR